MLLDTRRIAARTLAVVPSSIISSPSSSSLLSPSVGRKPCSSPSSAIARVATAFICEDGGKMNIGAKLFATLWYLLIMPDSTSRLKRQVRTKRLPWYSPARILGIAVAAANVVSVPASWVLLIAGRRNASRVASLGVLANPPTLQISVILVQEIVKQVMGSSCSLVVSCGTLLSKPVKMLMSVGRGGSADEQGEDETPSAGDDSATGSTPPPPPPPTTTTTTTTGSDKPATTDTTPTKPAATTGTPTPVGSTPKTDAASTTSAPGPKP